MREIDGPIESVDPLDNNQVRERCWRCYSRIDRRGAWVPVTMFLVYFGGGMLATTAWPDMNGTVLFGSLYAATAFSGVAVGAWGLNSFCAECKRRDATP